MQIEPPLLSQKCCEDRKENKSIDLFWREDYLNSKYYS
jgi:hypothetical protein